MNNKFLLSLMEEQAQSCTRCKLSDTRTNVVFGEGSPEADLVVIGESPGQSEDESGKPFCGRSGGLLTKWLNSIELTREGVYICNIIKCRPPNNRNPDKEEVDNCREFLISQITIIQPKVILLVGAVALKTLFGDQSASIMRQRGNWMTYESIPVMPTYHPAFLLRQMSEENKDKVKTDLLQVKEKIDGIKVECG